MSGVQESVLEPREGRMKLQDIELLGIPPFSRIFKHAFLA